MPQKKKLSGLSDKEARYRLHRDGPNTLPDADRRNALRILRDVLSEPMFLMLLATAGIYLLLGDKLEGCVMMLMNAISVGLVVVQERRSEKVLESLRRLSQPTARVIREGKPATLPSGQIVYGDILALDEGNHIVADAILLDSHALYVDESMLTGESVPVQKQLGDPVYSGCLIVRGHAQAEVIATGIRSRLGQIGKAVTIARTEPTPMQRATGHAVRHMAIAGIALSILAGALYAVLRQDWLGGSLAGLSLAMALMPEEFPMVLTVFMAMGAWRLSRVGVLTRRSAAIETLGATTALCVDKTGTLTENRMTVARLWCDGITQDTTQPHEASFIRLAEYAALASRPTSFDPMDRAAHELAQRAGIVLRPHWRLLREYELNPSLLAMSQVWSRQEDCFTVAAKGAPEAVIDLCHLPPETADFVLAGVRQLADEGLRVLGVAEAFTNELTDNQHDFSFRFVGLIGFHDPLRIDVAPAVEECRQAGIRVIMITGDYANTAQVIARAAGLDANRVLAGKELETLSATELQKAIKDVRVFARVQPEQKLKLVEALQGSGEIVAMTGDGVNDAPALKAAHIGVAMGQHGSDVAREAAALVLLKDDFGSLVAAVRMGRRIHDNLLKAMSYIISIHVPIAGLALLPILTGWPMLLLPVEIVFLELVIDPVCATVFEAENAEPGLMKRPPHSPSEPLFNRRLVLMALGRGVLLLLTIGIYYGVTLQQTGEEAARSLTFSALVIANLMLVLSVRAKHRPLWAGITRPLIVIIFLTFALLGAALTVPIFREIFRFSLVPPDLMAQAAAVGAGPILLLELFKRRPKQTKTPTPPRRI
ncbi:cation-translocating P-type ATPase [Candidatus Methylospira mobilis]|uniref:cation-translocating P-type ATPase n=1 Tax=Candidatus Methylospira mobilis TaxID=1808979 RepID=UPI0028E54472|nr:cation-translocating P-type ATPase [Candidatus Methylospira mobilis]WNV03718.1 cation-translocating P-type ATPase [Candidatus Methylospira mobilis]